MDWQKGLAAFCSLIAVAIVIAAFSLSSGIKTCKDITTAQLNHVYEGSLMDKLGMKFLDVVDYTTVGNNNGDLNCKITALTNHGKMDFTASTSTIHGSVYIEVRPVF